jgi:uncharacterized membrane protein SpoIIM required for sporulation
MVKTRNASGRFESTPMTPTKKMADSDEEYNPMETIKISRKWITKVIFLLSVILLASPWMFLLMKNNALSVISNKVSEFYDDNFSCKYYQHAMGQNNSEYSIPIKENKF